MATDTTHSPKHDRVDARRLSFYEVDASTIDDAARKLVINYAGVAPEDVEKHIDAVVRNRVILAETHLLTIETESESLQHIPLSLYRNVQVSRLERSHNKCVSGSSPTS
jgi:hypothetical protein